MVLRPTPILELSAAEEEVVQLAAGRATSGAVTAAGHVVTWGAGQAGQSGHGCAADVQSPSRVESLVGRMRAAALAMGDNHTLFLDCDGRLWGCGENREVRMLGACAHMRTRVRARPHLARSLAPTPAERVVPPRSTPHAAQPQSHAPHHAPHRASAGWALRWRCWPRTTAPPSCGTATAHARARAPRPR